MRSGYARAVLRPPGAGILPDAWLLLMPLRALLALRRSHSDLAHENLALCHQLYVALRTNPRLRRLVGARVGSMPRA